jgi:ergothioneine biosynthesis protein EgtB
MRGASRCTVFLSIDPVIAPTNMKTEALLPQPVGFAERLAPSLPAERRRLASRYCEVRSFTESLCEPLVAEDYVIQSMPDVSPAKWHLAHTTWFFETFVLERSSARHRGNPHFHYLFNSYYNAAGPMHCRAKRGVISRPTVQETRAYRRQIDGQMADWFESAPAEEWRELEPVLVLGLHHEQQHQELLLTDIKHVFAQNPLYPLFRERRTNHGAKPPPLKWLQFSEGLYSIGHEGGGFCFDNERPRHRVFLEPFQIASRPITNGEFLAFIEDGGYERPELWLSLGWFAVNDQKWTAPLYWEKRGGVWHTFTLAGLRRLEPSEPVCHVSYFEADAFARWAGARLPFEAEWEVAAAELPVRGNFADVENFHPMPPPSGSEEPAQMFGDVWEWTHSSYAPYPGYAPPQGALGEYNGKFMCNQYVLRGGSCATSRAHIRHTYRNFFPPEKQWQFSGIRLAKNAA